MVFQMMHADHQNRAEQANSQIQAAGPPLEFNMLIAIRCVALRTQETAMRQVLLHTSLLPYAEAPGGNIGV